MLEPEEYTTLLMIGNKINQVQEQYQAAIDQRDHTINEMRQQYASLMDDRNSVVREYNTLLERHNALNQKLSQVQ